MTPREITLAALYAVEAAGLDYIIVGALAVNCYAFARATKDVDFVLGVPLGGIDAVLPHLSSEFAIDPQPRMELTTGTFRWIMEVKGSDFCVEFFHLSNDAHHREEFARRRQAQLESLARAIWIPTAEDLVIQKVRWGRRKDLDDVVGILSTQLHVLDFPYMERWCDEHGTRERLEEMRRSIPPGI